MSNRLEESFRRKPAHGVALILGTTGLLCLAAGAFTCMNTRELIQSSERARGEVIEVVEQSSPSLATNPTTAQGVSYRPKVRFRTATGEEVTFVSPTGSNPASHAVGDEVEVLYRTDSPSEAVVDSFVHTWLLPVLLTLGGLPLTLAAGGIVAWIVSRKRIEAGLRKRLEGSEGLPRSESVDRLMAIMDRDEGSGPASRD